MLVWFYFGTLMIFYMIELTIYNSLKLFFCSNIDKTISWLAKETSQRYYSLCGLQPLLTLSTKDGAFLSPDDPISLVLSTNEEIVGNVDNWDLPPLSDRYEQACKTLSSEMYMHLPVHKHKSNKNLDDTKLIISFTKGNRIGDNGLEGFLKVCSSIPNLRTLDLSCNMITAGGIKSMADCLTSNDVQNCLQSLLTLNLSHNPLGDTVCLHLATIVSNLPNLTDMSLSACEFTSKLFQQYRVVLEDSFTNFGQFLFLKFTMLPLTGKHLQSMSLSRNPKLNNQSLRKILEIAAKHDSKLEWLTLMGCGIKSPIDTNLLDSICDKLSCPTPLKYLKFTCYGLDKVDKDSLRQIWTQQWRDDGVILYTDSTTKCVKYKLYKL
ncbi:hypothetical protein KUTeg_018970 [Tegillarca granosa]|uniref:Uncharacterized protein n=1 Tax=Tegillarca granosa TaxID=220873 RepID=A0ABQ9EB51_TEGGR|nr:hypothetical protein KUTeg_018970 [Tegillarca granosa]